MTETAVDREETQDQSAPSGTPSHTLARAFVGVYLLLLLVPLIAMPLASSDASAEKRELAAFPQPTDDGRPNLSYASQAGAWFEDHFAFRTYLVDAYATALERLFMTSAVDNVVVGGDGWLYYAGAMPDYQRTNLLSDRALCNIAYDLGLIERYVRAQGKGFCVAVAPNKTSLYPQRLPYYELPGAGESNLQRLTALLDEQGVTHVDLREALLAQDETLYYHRDSHWNDAGALVGYQAIMAALEREPDEYPRTAPSEQGHVGDVDGMLHPLTAREERGPLWDDSRRFAYTNGATSVEDATIETKSTSQDASGTVLVFRDSFGNALLPFLATSYRRGVFSKMVPYDLSPAVLDGVDDVIIERVERHLAMLGSNPPYLPAPEVSGAHVQASIVTPSTVNVVASGPYAVVEGDLDPAFAGEDMGDILVAVHGKDGDTRTFVAFHVGQAPSSGADADLGAEEDAPHVTTDYGYRAHLPRDLFPSDEEVLVEVLVIHAERLTTVASKSVNLGG